MEKEEFKKEYVRMMDSARNDKNKGRGNCDGVSCSVCPLDDFCWNSINAFETIEAVEKWAKEHPIVTMAGKFKEVFGVEPKNALNDLTCPTAMGFMHMRCGSSATSCTECKEKFWTSEYKEPGKETE